MEIKNIIFDFEGVLYHFTDKFTHRYNADLLEEINE